MTIYYSNIYIYTANGSEEGKREKSKNLQHRDALVKCIYYILSGLLDFKVIYGNLP